MPLEHDLARLGRDPDAVNDVHRQGHHAQSGGRAPELPRIECKQGSERETFEVGDEIRAEFKVKREEGGGEEGVAQEINGEDAGLEQAKRLPWHWEQVSDRQMNGRTRTYVS